MALGRVGGLLEAKKIAGMAEAHYAQIAPHLYCGPIEGAANIQLATCSPNFLILESIQTWGGFHAEILRKPIHWEDGYVIPPTEPRPGRRAERGGRGPASLQGQGASSRHARPVALMRLGFIGLGHLGAHLARSLLRAGFTVVVHDLECDRASGLIAAGAAWGASPREVAAQADSVITCLPSPAAVAAVVEAADGVLAGCGRAAPGST